MDISISVDACSVWMYPLIADKAQLVSTSYSSLLKIYKNENKMFAAILMKQNKVPTSCVLSTYTCTCTRTYTNAVVTCKLCQTVFSAVSIRTRSQALARTADRTASYYLQSGPQKTVPYIILFKMLLHLFIRTK